MDDLGQKSGLFLKVRTQKGCRRLRPQNQKSEGGPFVLRTRLPFSWRKEWYRKWKKSLAFIPDVLNGELAICSSGEKSFVIREWREHVTMLRKNVGLIKHLIIK